MFSCLRVPACTLLRADNGARPRLITGATRLVCTEVACAAAVSCVHVWTCMCALVAECEPQMLIDISKCKTGWIYY